MICKEIIDIIEKDYSRDYAMDWDNVGLLVGRDDKEIRKIYLSLDATDEVICDAAEQGADLLITHHPLIFGGMKQITNRDFIGNRILALVRGDISYYAMHTNYDVLGMAKLSADMMNLKQQEPLEVTSKRLEESEENTENLVKSSVKREGIGRIGWLETPVTLRQCCEVVKDIFGLEAVRVFGNPDCQVEKVALCPGSGKSVIGTAIASQADVLVTGDIGHHEGIDAAAQGMAVIDAGHYGLEHIFVEDMNKYLIKKLEGIEIITAPVQHPFMTI